MEEGLEKKLKEIREDLVEKTDGRPDNPVVDVFLLIVLIALVGALFGTASSEGGLALLVDNQNSEAAGRPVPSVTYEVRANGVFPYEHTVAPGENVAVYNEMDSKIYVMDEGSNQVREVKSENYIIYTPDRITYFEVNNSERELGSLKINVQRP